MFAWQQGYSECKMTLDHGTLDEHQGLRERKKVATRRAIRMHALELFAAKGYSGVTVEDIAEAADVSPRTFFNYFPSKEAVIFGTEPETIESLRRQLVEAPASLDPLQALSDVLSKRVSSMADEVGQLGCAPAEIMGLLKEAAVDPAFRAARAAEMALMERALAEALAERLGTDLRRDPYPVLVASCAASAIKVASFYWANLGGKVPVENLVASAFQAISEGLPEKCDLREIAAEFSEKGESTK